MLQSTFCFVHIIGRAFEHHLQDRVLNVRVAHQYGQSVYSVFDTSTSFLELTFAFYQKVYVSLLVCLDVILQDQVHLILSLNLSKYRRQAQYLSPVHGRAFYLRSSIKHFAHLHHTLKLLHNYLLEFEKLVDVLFLDLQVLNDLIDEQVHLFEFLV